jgi:pimeloyl-ACP methyl ester carboxylesterase
MAVFVLVHGGWGGGWEWQQVADRLVGEGHVAHRPTLTGLGERQHLAGPQVGLDTHIADVMGVLAFEDLREVILVGQSYGGAVVTGVADRAADRLQRLVYVDAFVLRHGESVNDVSPPGFVARLRSLAARVGNGLVPLPFSDDELGLPEEVRSWYAPRLVPQPLSTLDEPIELTGAGDDVPRTYVDCRPDDVEADRWVFTPFALRAAEAGWDCRRLAVGHDAHVLAPDALTTLLLELTFQ